MTTPLKSDNTDCPLFRYALDEYKRNSNHRNIDIDEFQDDYNRFWFVLKLLVIYRNRSELNSRLLINHLIILTNNFGGAASKILLKIAIEKGDYDIISYVMTILDYIGFIPENRLVEILGEEYMLESIPLNKVLLTHIQQETQ